MTTLQRAMLLTRRRFIQALAGTVVAAAVPLKALALPGAPEQVSTVEVAPGHRKVSLSVLMHTSNSFPITGEALELLDNAQHGIAIAEQWEVCCEADMYDGRTIVGLMTQRITARLWMDDGRAIDHEAVVYLRSGENIIRVRAEDTIVLSAGCRHPIHQSIIFRVVGL